MSRLCPKTRTAQAFVVGIFILATGAISACNFRYEKENDRDGTLQELSESVGFDTIDAEIIRPKCLGCHTTRAPVLTSYEAVKANLWAIEDAVLVRRIMPKNGALSDSLRAMLRKWIDDGAPLESIDPRPAPTATSVAGIPRPYTYADLKKDVLESKCISCHSTGNEKGITPFDTYAGFYSVKNIVVSAVLGFDGANPIPTDERMPPAGEAPLTDSEKALFLIWSGDGNREAAALPDSTKAPSPPSASDL